MASVNYDFIIVGGGSSGSPKHPNLPKRDPLFSLNVELTTLPTLKALFVKDLRKFHLLVLNQLELKDQVIGLELQTYLVVGVQLILGYVGEVKRSYLRK